ncbi:MAG: hypothetical protein V5B32_15795 [Candidatus Accumulibacter sp. UW26]|jgi:hypothetical protein|uniref:hypothetical protein n=1 Tax=Candidatus Accumulibacter contiguus TaxID=2954381 RepID=UPI00207B9B81|nr:hypothetical protein [Candidatus Accumulibacter contiguus]
MPSPTADQLAGLVRSTLDSAGIHGRDAPGLARALAKTTAQALAMFLTQAEVLPGIPASAPPPANSGSTVGPGSLLPPPAGGPTAAQLENLALADLKGEGIAGANAPDLAKVIAGSLAQAIELFTAQVQVAPGIAISGLVTTAPGSLI